MLYSAHKTTAKPRSPRVHLSNLFKESSCTLACLLAISATAALGTANASELSNSADSMNADSVGDNLETVDTLLVDDPRVAGGTDADPGAWPNLVVLSLSSAVSDDSLYDRSGCGGSIIDARWVLTAAHCVTNDSGEVMPAQALSIYANVTDLRATNLNETLVTNIYVHPNYSPNIGTNTSPDNDIALLELATAVNAPDAFLFSGDTEDLSGLPGHIAGWGLAWDFDDLEFYLPNVLQQSVVPFVSSAECNAPEVFNGAVNNTKVCAGYKEGGRTTSCRGDSGGPLYAISEGRQVQIGITSWGANPCAQENFYTIYTSVPSFLPWIRSYVQERNTSIASNTNTNTGVDSGAVSVGGSAGSGGSTGLLLLVLLTVSNWRRGVRLFGKNTVHNV